MIQVKFSEINWTQRTLYKGGPDLIMNTVISDEMIEEVKIVELKLAKLTFYKGGPDQNTKL